MTVHAIEKLLTGVPELDQVLRGGLPKSRVHLLEGEPGTGKTTLGLKFLIEGVKAKDGALYVTMSESAEELRSSAAAHGWDLNGIDIFELVPLEAQVDEQQTVLFPSEVELGETVKLITDRIQEVDPARVVIDSLSELRLLASDQLRYRRQLLALKQFLHGQRCTTLLLDDLTANPSGKDLHSVVHGVVSLEVRERNYGAARRRLRVVKMRGADFQSGWHDFAIQTGQILVFPSLIAEEHKTDFEKGTVNSGMSELDDLVGGGLDRGTVNMLVGPSGTGKTSLALKFAMAAVRRGERAAFFSFDETFQTWLARGTAIDSQLGEALDNGDLSWERANPSRLSPGEFVWHVRRQVEDNKARVVVIDSLNSYLKAENPAGFASGATSVQCRSFEDPRLSLIQRIADLVEGIANLAADRCDGRDDDDTDQPRNKTIFDSGCSGAIPKEARERRHWDPSTVDRDTLSAAAEISFNARPHSF